MNSAASEYLDILVLCSSPIDLTPNLNLHQELALFEEAVRNARIPIRMRRVFPPTYEQLEKTLRGFQPQVFHYLGHGEEDGLWFEDARSSKNLIKAKASGYRRFASNWSRTARCEQPSGTSNQWRMKVRSASASVFMSC